MKNLFTISLLCLVFVFSPVVQAEEVLRNDYVITNQNDTLFGKVFLNIFQETPRKIEFSTHNENKPITYFPDQIREFRYKDDLYLSKPITLSDQEKDSIAKKSDHSNRFVILYVRGKASLYGYVDSFNQKHFYLEADNRIDELIYTVSAVEKNGVMVEKVNSKYKGLLKYSLRDDPKLASAIDKSLFTDVSLTRIVKQYNQNINPSDNQFVSRVDREKAKITLGVITGLSISNISFSSSSSSFDYLTKTSFERDYKGCLGVNVEYLLPSLRKRLSFYQEIMYVPLKMDKTTTTEDQFNQYIKKTAIDFSYIRFSNMLRFSLIKQKQYSFYLGAGPGVSFSLKRESNTSTRNIFKINGNSIEQNINDDSNFLSWGIDFIGAVGFRLNRVALEYRYDQMLNISKLMDLSAYPHTQFLLLQYSF